MPRAASSLQVDFKLPQIGKSQV